MSLKNQFKGEDICMDRKIDKIFGDIVNSTENVSSDSNLSLVTATKAATCETTKKSNSYHLPDKVPRYPINYEWVKNNNNAAVSVNERFDYQEPYNYQIGTGFCSLPSRGRSARVSSSLIKFQIDTDTSITSKTIVYRDRSNHMREKDNKNNKDCDGQEDTVSQHSSSDSIDSDKEPEITAALDTIALSMGMVNGNRDGYRNEKGFNDSVKAIQILKTTNSFSEKMSSFRKKTSPQRIVHRRVNSQINRLNPVEFVMPYKQIMLKTEFKSDQNAENKKPKSETPKSSRESFGKLFGKFSSSRRRSKSESPVNFVDNANSIADSKNHPVLECEPPEVDEKIIPQQVKPLLQSIKQDHVEDVQSKYKSISAKRKVNYTAASSRRHPVKVEDPISDVVFCSSSSVKETRKPNLQNPRYVSLSLSAFGYGPNNPAYKSMSSDSFSNQSYTSQISNSRDPFSSDNERVSDFNSFTDK